MIWNMGLYNKRYLEKIKGTYGIKEYDKVHKLLEA
jgi:hypothetical protein